MSKALSAAMLVLSFAGATQAAEPNQYAQRAREVTEHIQRTFFDPRSGVYFKSLTVRKPDYVWLQSVMFSNLVAAARSDPATYGPLLQKYFKALDAYWDSKVKIPGYEAAPTRGNGNDKYYDDNAWLVITFLEAYETNHDPRYLARADETLKFVLSGWDEEGGGGIWWHQLHKDGTKNACANGPAAVGCLRLAKFRDEQAAAALVEQARKIVAWTVSDAAGGRRPVRGPQGRRHRRGQARQTDVQLRADAPRAAGPVSGHGQERVSGASPADRESRGLVSGQQTGVYRDAVRYAHFMVEADLELYRTTKEEYLLKRAKKNVDAFYESWKAKPPDDMISNAAIARVLWLMAETETDAGRAFWQAADRAGK